jgi:hypothetical protein
MISRFSNVVSVGAARTVESELCYVKLYGASTRDSTFCTSTTNGSTILNTMQPYFNGFMFQQLVDTVQ